MAATESKSPIPTRIVVHQKSRVLELEFEGGQSHRLSFEFLRVHSPSAEVRGHGPGQEVLQVGKRDVGIERIEPVGNYAIQPRFTDGHATGIYSWDYLQRLVRDHDRMWEEYLRRLEEAGKSRDPAQAASSASGPSGARGAGAGQGEVIAASGGLSAVSLSRKGKPGG